MHLTVAIVTMVMVNVGGETNISWCMDIGMQSYVKEVDRIKGELSAEKHNGPSANYHSLMGGAIAQHGRSLISMIVLFKL